MIYLNCHSNYSLRYGTFPIDRLVKCAHNFGVKTLALTDINNVSGVFDFYKACKEFGIKPIVGIEFRKDNQFLYIALAKNEEGFNEINRFLTYHNINDKALPDTVHFKEAFTIYQYGAKNNELEENEYWGIHPGYFKNIEVTNLKTYSKIIACHPVVFEDNKGYSLHQRLRAVDNNVLFSRLEKDMIAQPYEHFFKEIEYCSSYEIYEKDNKKTGVYDNVLLHTQQLANQCNIQFDIDEVKNKKYFTTDKKSDIALLKKLTLEGVPYRYGPHNEKALLRINKELSIIDELNFSSYFLITWDMVKYSMSRGFYHVGRGSGANSIVAYCLRITDVDPLELDLYFERFLNPKRSTPPDFDIDYSWKDRDEIIEYLFKKYGKEHVALLGTISTFRGSSIIRELAKTYGLPKHEIDQMVDFPASISPENAIAAEIMELGTRMQDFPNIRSIHAGGILITEKPITYYSALDLPPKGFPTVQWDMYTAESINIEKLDVLSQRGLGHIKDCAALVYKNQNFQIDVHDVKTFMQDVNIKTKLRKGHTIGCFYIESPAMRQLLRKLHCDNFLHLVAASSIIRPGVSSSGMMKQFIERFHDSAKIHYLHPVMKEQLEETFGIMVYQEDVLKICHHYAGLDLSDADVLRRAMSGKYRSKDAFQELINKFFQGALQLGRDEEVTKEVWRQISSFGGYSFCKAHSASFAVESFQSLYLKTYFPHEFMVSVINNFGGFYRTWVYVKEAMRGGAIINLPCINKGNFLTCIYGKDIYLGLGLIEGIESNVLEKIEKERSPNPFSNLIDLVKRTQITREQLFLLIRVGALRDLGPKKELLWQSTFHTHKLVRDGYKLNSPNLFEIASPKFELPILEETPLQDAFDEMELLGFPVSLTEFQMLKTKYRGNVKAIDLDKCDNKTVRIVGLLVATKDLRTRHGHVMKLGTFFDCEYQFFDTVHFSQSEMKYKFTGQGVYLLEGKVICDFNVPALEVQKMAKLPYKI